MFEKLKEKQLSNYVEGKLKISERENKKNEGLKNYYETQGLEPELKDKNILFDIAYNLQQTNTKLEKKSEVFIQRLLKHEVENTSLEKENKDINKRVEAHKHNIDIFNKTLENFYEENKNKEELSKEDHTKIIDDALEACNGPLSNDKINMGLSIEALVNDWMEEDKAHNLVMNSINVRLQDASKSDENVIEMER